MIKFLSRNKNKNSKHEWDKFNCARCGIHAYRLNSTAWYPLLCMECQWIVEHVDEPQNFLTIRDVVLGKSTCVIRGKSK
jgi:hypothetical protein